MAAREVSAIFDNRSRGGGMRQTWDIRYKSQRVSIDERGMVPPS